MAVNVLVLEDQPGWEALLASAVNSHSLPAFAVQRAQSYPEAVALIAQTPFDLALLDYNLAQGGPEGARNGLDVARALRAVRPQATILLITMVDPERVQARCAELGVVLIEKGRGDLEEEIVRELRDGLAAQGLA